MSSAPQPLDIATLEQLLFQVRGIQAARIVTDAQGLIDEVHVVGLPGRLPKQIVRDIESILYVQGGVRLDHRKVSLVQVAEGVITRQNPRVLLLEVRKALGSDRSEVSVTLGFGERQTTGTSTLDGASTDLLTLAAQATTSALAELIGARAELHFEHIASQPFGRMTVCLSHLSLAVDERVETLLGISLLRDDEAGAAARSVLDAVNRQLQRLLNERL